MTGEVRGRWPAPGSGGAPGNGDQVQGTTFLRGDLNFGWDYAWAKWDTRLYRSLGDAGWGYAAAEVDELLRQVAAELDAGRPAWPLIENATFRRRLWSRRYDIDAVDWFLNQLLPADRAELADAGADPGLTLP